MTNHIISLKSFYKSVAHKLYSIFINFSYNRNMFKQVVIIITTTAKTIR